MTFYLAAILKTNIISSHNKHNLMGTCFHYGNTRSLIIKEKDNCKVERSLLFAKVNNIRQYFSCYLAETLVCVKTSLVFKLSFFTFKKPFNIQFIIYPKMNQ
ncbi:UNVERIFIED_CONTAM: hypothetical protein K2H54_047297 [Gekko kuhli]